MGEDKICVKVIITYRPTFQAPKDIAKTLLMSSHKLYAAIVAIS